MDDKPPQKKPQIHRSYSSPILSSKAKAATQSLESQLRVFADKFVDVNEYDYISRSPSLSSISSVNESAPSWMISNTLHCRHRHPCFQNCWARGVVRTFAAGYITRTTWSLFSTIFQIQYKKININNIKTLKLKEFFRSIYFNLNSLRFALGLTILSFTYKFSLCFIFRRLINKLRSRNNVYENNLDKYIYPALSGFIAGFLSLKLIKNKSTRNTVALFCIVRAISDLLRVLGKMNKLFLKINHFESIVFVIFQIPIMYAFMHEPSSMNKTYFQWILTMGSLSQLQMRILRIFMRYPRTDTDYDDYPLLSCNPIFHERYTNCYVEHCTDWCYGIFRAAQIYIPVHWLPAILLTPKKIMAQPWYYFKIKFVNTLRSSLFLTTYQFNMKLTECIGRKLIGSDIGYLSMSGGIAAGLAIFIEHPSRRGEIVLYVIPRAVEIIINHIPDRFTILSHDIIPILVFSTSLSLFMAIRQCPGVITVKQQKKQTKRKKNICNDLNMTVLSVIFGRFH